MGDDVRKVSGAVCMTNRSRTSDSPALRGAHTRALEVPLFRRGGRQKRRASIVRGLPLLRRFAIKTANSDVAFRRGDD
jgi:hypothetical protein